jgi:hypothetical protein
MRLSWGLQTGPVNLIKLSLGNAPSSDVTQGGLKTFQVGVLEHSGDDCL